MVCILPMIYCNQCQRLRCLHFTCKHLFKKGIPRIVEPKDIEFLKDRYGENVRWWHNNGL